MSDLRATLDEFAAREVNLVVVNSGDGTVQASADAPVQPTAVPDARRCSRW